MSSGKITRFQNNVRIDGDLNLSNSTGRLTLSSLSSAPSSPAVGDSYYDTTLQKARIYQDSGWTNVDGTAAGSLNAAYDGGATITVDGGAVTLTDGQSNTAGALLITKSTIVSGSDSNSIFHINSTATHTTSGTMKAIEISVAADSGSQTQIGIELEMPANTDSGITITKGAVTLTDGAMTLTSGNFTMSSGNADITGTLDVSGTVAAAAAMTVGTTLTVTGNTIAGGTLVVDVDNATAFVVQEEGATAVLTVDTTQDVGDTSMLLTAAVTTGTGFHIDGSTITTGDALKITVAAATMEATGAAISVVADGVEVFAVRDDGSTLSIKGTAEGTTALGVTTGDVVVTDGDLVVAGGEVAFTSDSTTAGLVIVNNTITTAASMVDISSTSISTGALMRLNANTTAHDGEILELINAGDTGSTAAGLSITMPDITTGTARGIDITMVGLTTTGFGIKVTMDAITTGDMLYLDNGGGTLTGAGRFINCNDDDASLFSVAGDGATVIAGTAAGTAALTLSLGDLVITDTDATTIDSVNGTGDIVTITGGGVTGAGNAMLVVTSTGAIADGAFYVDITSGSNGVSSTASYLLHVDASHTQIEAIHVDAGNVLFDEGLTVVGTLTQTGIATFATGLTQTAVSRTPTVDGTGAGTIAAGTSMVDVTGGTNVNCWLTLPTPVVGHVIWLIGTSGTNFEVRTNSTTTVAINGGTDTNGESNVSSGVTCRLVCTSATTWVGTQFAAAGTESPMTIAAD